MQYSRRRIRTSVGLLPLAWTLAGCAPRAPSGPTVLALPAPGESFTVFQEHEAMCRQYASAQTGGRTPGQEADRTGVRGAVAGTGLGAAAGALIGSASGHAGTGAAIGAGSGLLAGSILGSVRGRGAAAATQNSYNLSYTQCMIANKEQIAPPVSPPLVYAAPYPVYVPAPVYVAPPVPVR